MRPWTWRVLVGLAVGVCAAPVSSGGTPEKSAAERGRYTLTHNPINPPIWSLKTYDNLWRRWGLAEKPGDYAEQVRERYGLHAAPFENGGRPMGLLESKGLISKGIVNNC